MLVPSLVEEVEVERAVFGLWCDSQGAQAEGRWTWWRYWIGMDVEGVTRSELSHANGHIVCNSRLGEEGTTWLADILMISVSYGINGRCE